jgi:serine/threonine protein phosphatase 1
MYYVMSDIHGEYDKYCEMLKKISFCDKDVLVILGDVVDRGESPAKLLLDMSLRENVYPIMGNHEIMALDLLKTLCAEITEKNYDTQITADVLKKLTEWQLNGGDTTMKDFRTLSADDRDFLISYMEEFEPYMTLKVGEKKFILTHAGLGNYRKDKQLEEYTLDELTFCRPDLDKIYYNENITVIVGHTPTRILSGKDEILSGGNLKIIDCGAAYGGRLACLCLDTMEEFYV